MKYFLFGFLCVFCITSCKYSFSESTNSTNPFPANPDSIVVGRNKNVTVFYKAEKKMYFISVKKNGKNITKALHNEKYDRIDSINIDRININQNDSDYVLIFWKQKYNNTVPNYESLSFNGSYRKVWNIDVMKELFSVQTSIEINKSTTIIHDPNANETVEETAYCTYQLDFSINENGTITLKYKNQNFTANCDKYKPEKEEGNYILKNMNYFKQK